MSAISNFLTFLRSAIYAIDVRDGIVDAIEQCYNDVNNPTLKTEALEAALQTKIDQGEMAALTIGDGTLTGAKFANGTIPKEKLDPSITFDADAALDPTSTNAIQNKVVASEIGQVKADLEDLDERVDALESGGGGSGLTDDVKTALMNLVDHLAWDDDDPTGQTYITALYNALYPPADLVSISVVYTQSGTVYDTDSLDSLKSDLVVTALMSDQTTRPVTDYTLSGTLTEGTSTITVSYEGQTATFNVTVSTHLIYSLYNHEFTGDPVESPYIDTGINLFDTDFSWTIICSVSREAAAPRYGWRLLNALQSESPYNGFYHGGSNTTSSATTNVKWVGNTNSAVNTYMKKAFVGTYKCAFVHSKDGGLQMYFKGNDDAVTTKTDNTAWAQITDAASLGIGGVASNSETYAFTGTIIKLEIYDYAFGSTAIDAFMGGS